MNLIHYTEEFKSKINTDLKKDIIYSKLEHLLVFDKLETLNTIDTYKGIYVVKFSKTNLCRVIVEPRDIKIGNQNFNVLFVRELISRNKFDYHWGSVIYPQLKTGEWLNNNPLPKTEIDSFIRFCDEQNTSAKDTLAQLPEQYYKWLEDFKIDLKFDIFEREDWVNYSIDNTPSGLSIRDVDKFRRTIKQIIYSVQNEDITKEEIIIGSNIYSVINNYEEIGIIITDFQSINQRRVIILHDGANLLKQEEHWNAALEKSKNSKAIEPNLEAISKDAFRAYPKWILNNHKEDYWSSIQKHDGTYNLSLLPEQINFLNDFKFPTYINGQAGSGKSTMLYYLFANVYSYKVSGEINGGFIFLTENNTLLEHTTQSVIGLLASNPEFEIGLSIDEKNNVRKYFHSFKNYLIKILPESERSSFSEDKYLDFGKLKEKYNNKYTRNKYSAEEVWFVISTYVYGYYEKGKIDTTEKYEDQESGIPTKFRIIEANRFQDIVTSSLSFYDGLLSEGWWDKIKLVRSIRSYYPKKLPQQYTVVFCDEAQDFSRIELRLILDSCEYTNYDLSNIEQVPVVFAGDALQTVSPIGFTVRRLQQMYYDTFKEVNFNYDKKKSTYTPKFNYRSTRPIVRLANIVQFYRKIALNEDFTLKQEAKRDSKSFQLPILHYKEWLLNPENRDVFKRKFKFKSFIVPVDLNEENDFIKNEELLSESFPDIKSSIDAKGAEYPEVVVYGFGDEYFKEFGAIEWKDDIYDFKKKFFFNKLYVAITRAQNELIIIDSKAGCENFWLPLLKQQSNSSDPKWENYSDHSEILPINPETLADAKESSEKDAFNNAILEKEHGIRDKNIARLMVASNIFLILGKTDQARLSDAHIQVIKENWKEAGDLFLKSGDLESAINYYFKGCLWTNIFNQESKTKGNFQEIQILISKMMRDGLWTSQELNRIYELRNNLNEVINNVEWYDKFVEKIITFVASVSNLGDKRDLIIILRQIVIEQDQSMSMLIASLCYDTKQYNDAIDIWDHFLFEEKNPSYSEKYIRAKIENSKDENDFLSELLWSGRLLIKFDDIEANEKTRLSNKIINYYSNNKESIYNSEIAYELMLYLYVSRVKLNDSAELNKVAIYIEAKAIDLDELILSYINLIHNSSKEEIAIFLKERWAKLMMRKKTIEKKDKQEAIKMINNIFIAQHFPFPDSNQPWTIEEIEKINSDPEMITSRPIGHIRNIEILNFRKFKKITLRNIGQFNLILGPNNSGKTSLLEAFLFSPNPDECLRNYLYASQQRNNNAMKENKENLLKNLLHNSSKIDPIQIQLSEGRRFWHYTLRNPTKQELKNKDVDTSQYLALELNRNKTEFSNNIESQLNKIDDPNYLKDIPFIPFGKGYSENIASIYLSEIGSERKLRNDFIKHLKLFIPDIVGILVDTEQDIIEIEEEVKGIDRKNPLHYYGEGANKLFRILVQLHAAQSNRLNIDEIDAGIHYSKFKSFWRIVLYTAKKYNVQLFATTHNEECIKYFWEVLQEEASSDFRPLSRIITLESHLKTNEIIPIIRDYDSMKYAYEHHLEIRGES